MNFYKYLIFLIFFISLSLGAMSNIDNPIDANGNTLLMTAVYSDNIECVRTLLINGATHNLQNSQGYTALMYAAYFAFNNIARLLLTYATTNDLNTQNNYGYTPLMYAVITNNNYLVKLIFDKYSKLCLAGAELRNNDGYSALDLAVQYEYIDIIKALIPDTNFTVKCTCSKCHYYDTLAQALKLAIYNYNKNIVKIFIDLHWSQFNKLTFTRNYCHSSNNSKEHVLFFLDNLLGQPNSNNPLNTAVTNSYYWAINVFIDHLISRNNRGYLPASEVTDFFLNSSKKDQLIPLNLFGKNNNNNTEIIKLLLLHLDLMIPFEDLTEPLSIPERELLLSLTVTKTKISKIADLPGLQAKSCTTLTEHFML